MVPIISDFLFDNPGEVLKELAQVNSVHDVFIVLIDSAFAFELPPISAGWIEAFDVETGQSQVMSRGAMKRAIEENPHLAGRCGDAGERPWDGRAADRRRRAADGNRDERVHRGAPAPESVIRAYEHETTKRRNHEKE